MKATRCKGVKIWCSAPAHNLKSLVDAGDPAPPPAEEGRGRLRRWGPPPSRPPSLPPCRPPTSRLSPGDTQPSATVGDSGGLVARHDASLSRSPPAGDRAAGDQAAGDRAAAARCCFCGSAAVCGGAIQRPGDGDPSRSNSAQIRQSRPDSGLDLSHFQRPSQIFTVPEKKVGARSFSAGFETES